MGQVDTFLTYTEHRLDAWGTEFALHRDIEYLGYCRKNMLQTLIEHKGEMPPPNTGYAPVECSRPAQEIEDHIANLARADVASACVLRAMYCGRGRRGYERLETARLLVSNCAGLSRLSRSQYYDMHRTGVQHVYNRLWGLRKVA